MNLFTHLTPLYTKYNLLSDLIMLQFVRYETVSLYKFNEWNLSYTFFEWFVFYNGDIIKLNWLITLNQSQMYAKEFKIYQEIKQKKKNLG